MARTFGAVVLAVGALAACTANASSATSAPSAEPNSPRIVAKDLRFDVTELTVPAGRPFTIVFENADAAPHNVAVYADESAGENLFRGDVFAGPASRVYGFAALAPGTYYFRCDVHSEMHGTVVAGPG